MGNHNHEAPTVPCGTCGRATQMTGTKRCDGCWEVEHRLADYLRTGGPNAWVFVGEALAKAKALAEAKPR